MEARALGLPARADRGRELRASFSGNAIRPALLLQISLLLLAVANLGRIPTLALGDRQAPLLVSDFGAGAVILVAAAASARNRLLRLDAVALCGLMFIAIGGLSALASVPAYGLSPLELTGSL